MQPAMNVCWVPLRNIPGPQHTSSWFMLPKLHTWARRKDQPLLSPWAGARHGAAREEHLSALLHATAALVSASNDAWVRKTGLKENT